MHCQSVLFVSITKLYVSAIHYNILCYNCWPALLVATLAGASPAASCLGRHACSGLGYAIYSVICAGSADPVLVHWASACRLVIGRDRGCTAI